MGLKNEAKVGVELKVWKIGGDRDPGSLQRFPKRTHVGTDIRSELTRRTGPMVKLSNQHECQSLEAQRPLESTDPLKKIME